MVVLWPYEWRVTSSNLVRYEIDFIFARCSFGSECERAKVNLVEGGEHELESER